MAAKTKKEIPKHEKKSLEDFTELEIEPAILTIQSHLDFEDNQNTITEREIEKYSIILSIKKSVIREIVANQEGKIVTLEERAQIPRKNYERELVGA